MKNEQEKKDEVVKEEREKERRRRTQEGAGYRKVCTLRIKINLNIH